MSFYERYDYELCLEMIRREAGDKLYTRPRTITEDESPKYFGKSIKNANKGKCILEDGDDPKNITPTIPRHIGERGFSCRVGILEGKRYVKIWFPGYPRKEEEKNKRKGKGTMLSEEQRGIAMGWKKQIELGIQDKEREKEDIKKEIEELKFKINIVRPVKDLIKDAMTKKMILIGGVDTLCNPKTLDQCMNKSEEEKGELEEQLKDKRRESSNLELEIIVDYQKLIVLKKDLEKSGS